MSSASTSKKRLPRRPVEQTRQLMLDAAVHLLLRTSGDTSDDALSRAVGYIRVPDVVQEASRLAAVDAGGSADDYRPLSIGALYQIWPTQSEFQATLMLHLAQLDSDVYPPAAMTAAKIAAGVTGDDLLRQTLRDVWQHEREDPLGRVLLAAFTWTGNDQVRSALAERYASFFASVTVEWSSTLAAAGRRVRAPYTEALLARSVAALIEGFRLLWLADPDALADPEGDDDSDLAIRAVMAVVDAFTERTDTDPETAV